MDTGRTIHHRQEAYCTAKLGSWTTRVIGCILLAVCGCGPRVMVVRNPGPDDTGLRYYRPKPYLLITPGQTEVATSKSSSVRDATDTYVDIQLQYLPDFSEEYAVHVRPGVGKADVEIRLQDGWNLVSLNQQLDSQFDENLSAMADVVRASAGLVQQSTGQGVGGTQKFCVRASNVPLGYYEAVLGRDCGHKRLYGWRYLGFVPYANCPLCPTGGEPAHCSDGTLPLYGLVFEQGVMVFRSIGEIGANPQPAERVPVTVGSTGTMTRTTTTTINEEDGRVVRKQVDVATERLPEP